MSNLEAIEYKPFEAIKHISDDGSECWNARELAVVLNYKQWRNFEKVLLRAILACKNIGYEVVDHFAEVSKTIEMIEREQLNRLKNNNKLMLDE